MGDLGDIFDMFSQDDEKKQRKGQDGESQGESKENSLQSRIVDKIVKNKVLLFGAVFIVILVLSITVYYFIEYVNEHGAKGIIDTVKPFMGN